jgi:hypothetical protein
VARLLAQPRRLRRDVGPEAHDRLIEALGETLALENRRYRVIELP